jgi:putative nucleotidyltransferase with HDIG domain
MQTSSRPLPLREGGPPGRRSASLDGGVSSRPRPPIVPSSRRLAQPSAALPSVPSPPSESRLPALPAAGTSVIRYLPAAILATLAVAVLPALLANSLIPARGVPGTIATLACAVALSLGVAALASSWWKRLHCARGVVFSDLMLWSFARRLWAERRLQKIRAAYGGAITGAGQPRVELLEGLSRLLETRNPYTYRHCRRVAHHAERIARALHLGPAECAEVRAAALVHDVGKIYTPAFILHKAGPLSDEEFEVIKRHAADGADMLAPVRDARLSAIVRHHHERIDGSGYPDGLSGEEIPLGARIIAVADTFDAITSQRPYRLSRNQQEGLAVLSREAGQRLDPDAVAAFLDVYTPRRAIASVSLSAAFWARVAPADLLRGWLFGGSPLAGLLPAVGAAGLLAVTPAARYERAAAVPRVAVGASALQPAFPGALPSSSPQSSGPRSSIGQPGSRLRRAGPPASGPGQAVPPIRQGSPGAPAPAAETGGGAAARPSERLPAVEVQVPVPEGAGRPTPTVEVPPATTPPLALPGITVSPATAPRVTAGSGVVTAGPISTPAVEAGSVSVPSVSVPGVRISAPGG